MFSILFILFTTGIVSLVAGINLALLLKVYNKDSPPSLFILGGLITISIYLQVVYIIIPINQLAWAGIIFFMVILSLKLGAAEHILFQAKSIVSRFSTQRLPTQLLLILIVSICSLNIIIRPGAFDTGSYHLQAIKWAEHYPVLPGLVNVTCQFGFNSSWFLLNAFSGMWFIGMNSVYIMNCFILVLFISYLLRKTKNSSEPEGRFMKLFRLVSLIFCLPFIFFKYTGEVSPDFPIIIFTCWLFLLSLEKIFEEDNHELKNMLLFIVPIYLLTIKISSLPLCLFSLIQLKSMLKKYPKTAVITGVITLVPWVYNNVIISGYIVFPLTFTNLEFDWSYPEEMAKVVNERIKGWARSPFVDSHIVSNMPFPDWVLIWYKGQKIYNLIILLASLSGLLAVFIYRKTVMQLIPNPHLIPLLKYIMVLLAGIIFWFISAPDFRFSYGYFFSLLCILIVIISEIIFLRKGISFKTDSLNLTPIAALVFLSLFLFLQFNFHKLSPDNLFSLNTYSAKKPLEIKLSPNQSIFHSSVEEKCWDLYFPCTCELYEGLELRGSTTTSGFRIQPTAGDNSPAVVE